MALEFAILPRKNFKKSTTVSETKPGFFFEGDNGATVLLVHGLTGTPNEMGYVAAFLNKKGYSVSCPRLANHGEPLRVLQKTKWQDFYGSVRTEFLRIKKVRPESPVFVAGLSMGALLALLLADEFVGAVSAVSCLSPTLFYDGWNSSWINHLLPLAHLTPLKHIAYIKEEPPYGIKNEAIRQRIHKQFKNASLYESDSAHPFGYPYFPVTLLCELKLLVKYLTKKLCWIEVPVQIIQARHDDVTSIKNAQFIYERISSVSKEIVLLEDSYHVITADQERSKVARRMYEFFGRQASI